MRADGQGFRIGLHAPARNVVWPEKLEKKIAFLSDTLCHGRATGTQGGAEAAFWIARELEEAGAIPFGSSWGKGFRTVNGTTGHNILGMIPGNVKNPSDRYIIVISHYDHLGVLNGKTYPGADANASGVVAMTSLAEMFHAMKSIGTTYSSNIIFAGIDAKELNMAGSEALWRMIRDGRLHNPLSGKKITSDKVELVINIDQIGSSLSPLDKSREDYIIMLGSSTIGVDRTSLLSSCNNLYELGLDIGLTYYGSRQFTDLFWNLSDQKIFADNGIPAVMFTSGITMNNNKIRDKVSTLNMEVLQKRIYLMYHWIERML